MSSGPVMTTRPGLAGPGGGLVVLGAAGDLGSEVTRRLRSLSPHVLLDHRTDTRREIAPCDVIDPWAVERALDRLPLATSGRWHLVTTVGHYRGADDPDGDWRALRYSIEVNLSGVAHFAAGMAHRLVRAGVSGRIVIVGSAAAAVGSRDIGYGAAKAGLRGLVRSLSKAYARRGVTAIGVEPGLFESRMSAAQSRERRAEAISQNHLGRALTLEEIADSVCYAVGGAPDAMSGTVVAASGGQT